MKPVTLNLASRPFRNNTLVGSLLTIVGVGLVTATGYNLYVYLGYGSAYARLQQEQAEDRARISQLQVEERQLSEQVRSRNFRQTYERGKLASELVRKSAFSWTQLFNTLETVVPPDVVMTAIRPNISSDEIAIRIEGVAKNSGAFLAFQDRLQRNPLFTDVYPSSERRLNPNLPDITFLLTCDYLPQAPPPTTTVAGAGGPESAPAAGTSTAAATPPAAEAEKAAAGAASPARDGGRATLAQASIPVGRDGRPVEPPVTPVLAPGALFIPAQPPTTAPGGRKGGKSRPTEPAPPAKGGEGAKSASATGKAQPTAVTSQTVAAKTAAAEPPAATAKPPAAAANPPAAATKAVASDVKPSAAPASGAGSPAGAAPKSGTPVRTTADGRVWDPNVPRTMPAQQKAALAAQPKPPERPAMATRLDVPLSFAGAPAGDVYERLAEAHGVRFDIQPGVDRAAPVTLNLQGRKLEDALALVAGQTRHRVRKVADGVYQVEGPESGRELAVPPVSEEPVSGETP